MHALPEKVWCCKKAGGGGDTKPYVVVREVENIEVLIDEAGGSAYLYGHSSGATLALEAPVQLGEKGRRLSMTRGEFNRWLYRGQRPNWIARMENRAWAVLFSWGILPDYMVTLEVTGRKSGRTISLPVAVAVVNGERYLVSMLGENVQWVHNVRATGGRAVLRRHGREEVHLEEIPAEQRAPVLKAYLQRAPGARPHVPVNKDATLGEFEQVATAFPVFRVVKDVHANSRV